MRRFSRRTALATTRCAEQNNSEACALIVSFALVQRLEEKGRRSKDSRAKIRPAMACGHRPGPRCLWGGDSLK